MKFNLAERLVEHRRLQGVLRQVGSQKKRRKKGGVHLLEFQFERFVVQVGRERVRAHSASDEQVGWGRPPLRLRVLWVPRILKSEEGLRLGSPQQRDKKVCGWSPQSPWCAMFCVQGEALGLWVGDVACQCFTATELDGAAVRVAWEREESSTFLHADLDLARGESTHHTRTGEPWCAHGRRDLSWSSE